MYTYNWEPQASADYKKIEEAAKSALDKRKKGLRKTKKPKKSSKQEGLFKQVRKTLKFLESNPRHPSLQTHEYDSLPHPWDPKEKVLEAYGCVLKFYEGDIDSTHSRLLDEARKDFSTSGKIDWHKILQASSG